MLDDVLQARGISTYSSWVRQKIREDHGLLTQEKLAGRPPIPGIVTAELMVELSRRGIDLEEASNLVDDEPALRRLGLLDQKDVLFDYVNMAQEERAIAQAVKELDRRAIAHTEIPSLLSDPMQLRRLGLLEVKEGLEAYYQQAMADSVDDE